MIPEVMVVKEPSYLYLILFDNYFGNGSQAGILKINSFCKFKNYLQF